MNAVDAAFDAALGGLRERYVLRLPEAIGELKKFAVLCEFGELDAELAATVGALAHRLSGSGETLGYPNITACASALERLLEGGAVAETAARSARALVRACEAACNEKTLEKNGAAPEQPAKTAAATVAEALLTFVALHSDPAVAQLLSDVFGARANISSCSTRAAALDAATAEHADLLLIDLDCPGCPLDAVGELFRDAEALKVPVVAITSQRRAAAIVHAVSEGKIDCLVKPVAPPNLHAKVFQILERKRMLALLCDDDRMVREFLKPRFEASGFKVQLAHDGEEVIALAREIHPSIIVLDRAMPKIEGLAVLQMLKADAATHEIPVLMLTSKAQPHEVTECLRAGAAAYMAKPFTPKAVVAKCQEILGVVSRPGC